VSDPLAAFDRDHASKQAAKKQQEAAAAAYRGGFAGLEDEAPPAALQEGGSDDGDGRGAANGPAAASSSSSAARKQPKAPKKPKQSVAQVAAGEAVWLAGRVCPRLRCAPAHAPLCAAIVSPHACHTHASAHPPRVAWRLAGLDVAGLQGWMAEVQQRYAANETAQLQALSDKLLSAFKEASLDLGRAIATKGPAKVWWCACGPKRPCLSAGGL
jgi:hypothetical protein